MNNEIRNGNPRNVYPKYQRAYLVTAAVCVACILIAVVTKGILVPYFEQLRARTFQHSLEPLIVSIFSEAVIFFAVGFGGLSTIGLWFDCKIQKSKWVGILAFLMLIPTAFILLEYLSWTLISQHSRTLFIRTISYHSWIKVLMVWIMPLASGMLFFFKADGGSWQRTK